jgi:Tfp pilus assembly protein PilW
MKIALIIVMILAAIISVAALVFVIIDFRQEKKAMNQQANNQENARTAEPQNRNSTAQQTDL